MLILYWNLKRKVTGDISSQQTGDVNQTAGRVAVLWKSQPSWDAASSDALDSLPEAHSEAMSCSSSASQAEYIVLITWKEPTGVRG